MASNTEHLHLLKKDPKTDGNETFNIGTILNENWDKIDGAVAELKDEVKNINVEIPDASLTQKGIVQLSSNTNSSSEVMAATPKAVKAAFDMADGGLITRGNAPTDWNNAMTTGMYRVSTETLNATYKNSPTGAYGYGILEVLMTVEPGVATIQRYQSHQAGEFWVRTAFAGGNWSKWLNTTGFYPTPAAGTDLNTIVLQGSYHIKDFTQFPNCPPVSPNAWGVLIVDATQNNYVSQTIIETASTGRQFYRSKDDSNKWYPWKEIADYTGSYRKSEFQRANLVVNSSGYAGLDYWTTKSERFQTAPNQTVGSFFYNNDDLTGGKYAILDSNVIGVTSGNTYTLSCDFHTAGMTSGAVQIEIKRSSIVDGTNISVLIADLGKWWDRKSVTFTTPTDPSGNGLVLRLVATGGGANITRGFARIKLSEVGTEQPYSTESDILGAFQSGANAKQRMVDAINAKGGRASTSMSWAELATALAYSSQRRADVYQTQNNRAMSATETRTYIKDVMVFPAGSRRIMFVDSMVSQHRRQNVAGYETYMELVDNAGVICVLCGLGNTAGQNTAYVTMSGFFFDGVDRTFRQNGSNPTAGSIPSNFNVNGVITLRIRTYEPQGAGGDQALLTLGGVVFY